VIFTIPVFFSQRQIAAVQSVSPSSWKAREVVASWILSGEPITVSDFAPVARTDFYRAHSREYVDAVLDCQAPNGFGTRDRAVADSLPYTSGSLLAAARRALSNRTVSVSPTSGFHHAAYDRGGGFCTFNGLLVAALAL
jgi:acetoin utilization deacetylase AcuC-like enzyme